ncbi:NUDIX domain-containing protein [Aliiruegeria lutimaris]|uniref:8-oxo-dGTP diphosphatase n=1 Tax=Aliiruegeria lutimaris TaxID=571298 RepID=A0A1G9E3F7_9RHOB|nr:NUDIX domain-containing protein [Aliiruegeria lutimaris]SDK70619.1 8-oxo-dGTP diphosphatase [Aliiruegeria lutimaris]
MSRNGFAALLEDRSLIGAKVALFRGETILCYQRDDFAHIPDPGRWDLPGGLREPGETILDCALREVQEEFGIHLSPQGFDYASRFLKYEPQRIEGAFLAGQIPQELVDAIVFGDEGQCWEMMPVARFLSHPFGVRELQASVALFWDGLDG